MLSYGADLAFAHNALKVVGGGLKTEVTMGMEFDSSAVCKLLFSVKVIFVVFDIPCKD